MAFSLPDLPYDRTALEPHVSGETLDYHHGKHHNTYVVNANKLIEGTDYASMSQEDIIKQTAGDAAKAGLFNNVAQIWNHTFFWHSMKPGGGGAPTGDIAAKIDSDLGGYDAFREEFTQAALTQFGSGWAWLAVKDGKLAILKTPNADTPLTQGATPLLTIDVWEHAYYIDHRNARPKWVETYLDHLVNWDFANANLAKA